LTLVPRSPILGPMGKFQHEHSRCILCFLCMATLVACEDSAPPPPEGELVLLTYNVAGLPQGISSSEPQDYIPLISPLLNGYDLVLAQEDFWYHVELSADVTHPFRSVPYSEDPDVLDMGDGLNRYSIFPFEDHTRFPWSECWGTMDCASDCLAAKGFSVARTILPGNLSVDVYNHHNEAGGCEEDYRIRTQDVQELLDEIAVRSVGMAVIVAGDTNLHRDDAEDVPTLDALLTGAGLADACDTLACGDDRIDRVMYRSSESVTLTPLEWWIPPEFVTADATDLSDHKPVAVRFHWQRN